MAQWLERASWLTIGVIVFAILWHYGAIVKAITDYLN